MSVRAISGVPFPSPHQETLQRTPENPTLAGMEQIAGKRLNIAYIVVAILMARMMGISASGKFTLNPGAVRVVHDVAGVPMSFLPSA